jgi:hypothetical protein
MSWLLIKSNIEVLKLLVVSCNGYETLPLRGGLFDNVTLTFGRHFCEMSWNRHYFLIYRFFDFLIFWQCQWHILRGELFAQEQWTKSVISNSKFSSRRENVNLGVLKNKWVKQNRDRERTLCSAEWKCVVIELAGENNGSIANFFPDWILDYESRNSSNNNICRWTTVTWFLCEKWEWANKEGRPPQLFWKTIFYLFIYLPTNRPWP